MTKRIALVDDDRNIITSVSLMLEAEGYSVDTYSDGEQALMDINRKPPDLLLLDIKMPRMDGIELLTKIRKNSTVPAIFLTSKDDELDEVLGLRMGADDYITKPFSQRLLLERVRTILRRGDTDNANDNEGLITTGNLTMHPKRHSCTWKDHDVKLTVTEFLILAALAKRPGIVKDRNQLLDIAYGQDIFLDDRTIDSHIKRLRRKFREYDKNFNAIETLYGAGYKYNES